MYTNGFKHSGDWVEGPSWIDRAGPASNRFERAVVGAVSSAACRRCRASLPDYVAAQLGGVDTGATIVGGDVSRMISGDDRRARLAEVAAHLDTCPDCAEIYLCLFEAEHAVAAGELGMAEHTPAPDLGFLPVEQPDRSDAIARWWNAAARRLGESLRVCFAPDLLAQLVPAPVAVRHSTGAGGRYHERLYTLAPRPGYPMSLTVFRDGLQPDRALVEVGLHYPDRSWPDLGGIDVALVMDGGARHAVTDPAGLAVFEDIPTESLGRMIIELPLPGEEEAGEM